MLFELIVSCPTRHDTVVSSLPLFTADIHSGMHMPVKASVIQCRLRGACSTTASARSHQQKHHGGMTGVGSVWVAGIAGFALHRTGYRTRVSSSVQQAFRTCKEPSRRMTNSLLALNGCVFAAQALSGGTVTRWGIKNNAAISAGQWWRLVTPACLHLNLFHLAINSMALHSLGAEVEGFSDQGRFLAIYTISAVASFATSYALKPHHCQGSSGAVFGVAGALAVYHYRHRHVLGEESSKVLQSLHNSLVTNLKIGLLCPLIDSWCHIGGLFGGALAAHVLGPSYVSSSRTGCMQTCTDSPPVALLARQGSQRRLATCNCVKCAINKTGIRMRTRTKFKNRLTLSLG